MLVYLTVGISKIFKHKFVRVFIILRLTVTCYYFGK